MCAETLRHNRRLLLFIHGQPRGHPYFNAFHHGWFLLERLSRESVMGLILEVTSGPLQGKQIEAKLGETVSIGRTPKASAPLADNFMSGAHFDSMDWA